MKLLDLSGCNCLNAKAIHEVEGLCPKLIGLRYGRHLGFSGGHINLEMGQAIGKSFPNLKWLNLRGSGIDRYGLQSILESCKGLEYLNVMGCPRLTQCSTLTDKVADILEFKCSKISNFYNYDHEYDQDFNGFDLGYS
ncbi:hypothetical protein AMTR_s00039p00229920 [Amborella trichopoda]|uniref:COI1 F-box domain-containing protein n=2 Tax=Amborella trichopoda TaxID=13333 RepID=U5D6E2_AMBTC|nr:hypothetical protein AMTR_s00039p00229920 [Amborella trichopoda]